MSSSPESSAPAENAAPTQPRRMSILVVDDEKNIRTTLSMCLEQAGYHVTPTGSEAGALEAVEREFYDLAFLDLRLGETSGLDLLPKLLGVRPALAVVVITAYATYDSAVEAIRRGAVDYLPKPFTPAQVRATVERILGHRALERRMAELEQQISASIPEIDFETQSPRMRTILDLLTRAAQSEAPILMRGESGTGKGVLARALHAQSRRSAGPFVTVNCPTLSEELLASELFGHVRGSFTGAVRDQTGRVEAAEGGTLFLDEIGEISPGLQAKLLRFLQEKQFERIGETRTRHADVRVVAATNRDLEEDVATGRFREDLFFRLNVIEIPVPPLRERIEDTVLLARRFAAFFSRQCGRTAPELRTEVEAALQSYPWPGNVRELRNVMERAVILWPSQTIGLEALPDRIAGAQPKASLDEGDLTLEELERQHILRVLKRAPTFEDAARILGINASTLWRKRRRYEE